MAASATKRFRLEGDSGDAVSAFRNLEVKLKDTDRAFGKMQGSAKGAGLSVGSVTANITRLAGVATAAGAFALQQMTVGLQHFDTNAKTAAQSIAAVEASMKSLIQISRDGSAFKNLSGLADRISAASGMNRGEAAGIAFTGTSAGLSADQIGIAADIRKIETNVSPVIERLADLKAAFPDYAGGNVRGISNALLVAAERSKVPLASLAGISLNPAKVASLIGADPSESLAALAAATIGSKSPEQAETQLSALADQLQKSGQFQGAGLTTSLERLNTMSPEWRASILTSKESLLGFESLKGRVDEIKAMRADIDAAIAGTGTGKDVLSSRIRIAEQNPELKAINLKAIADQRLEQAQRNEGLREVLEQGIITEVKGELQRRFQAGQISASTLTARSREIDLYDSLNLPLDKLALQGANIAAKRGTFQMQGVDEDVRDRMETRFMEPVRVFMEAVDSFKESIEKIADDNRKSNEALMRYLDKHNVETVPGTIFPPARDGFWR